MRILLVDDEKDFARALAQRLELRGVHCLLAHDADEALDVLERAAHAASPSVEDAGDVGAEADRFGLPELVFLDVHLPGMSGVELLPRLREAYPELDVVMLSGATELQTAVRAMRRGAVNWLPKPVDVDALLQECQRTAERKRQRRRDAQLAEAAMLGSLGRVAEGVAHEVNNPVNIMMQAAGWVEDLLDEIPVAPAGHGVPPDPNDAPLDEMREALHTIRVQSLRVRDITRRLLVFGKGMDAGHTALDVADIVGKAVELLGGQAQQAGVALDVNVDPALPRPSGSAMELHQACVHVLENALEALPQGGRVCIRAALRPATEAEDSAYLLHVEDNGPGMPPEVLAQAFDPFFSTKPKSAGLGLAVCRSLMRRRGGDAQAFCTEHGIEHGAGHGTRVTLTLPL